MKIMLKHRFVFFVVGAIFICNIGVSNLYAQETKKNSVRLKVDYFKIMDSISYFNIKAFARIDGETVDVSNIELTISSLEGDEEIDLGTATTNMNGECKFVLKDFKTFQPDSLTNTYNFVVSFKGNDDFKKASKEVSFKDASILAKLVTKDSLNYISATLKETATDSVLSDRLLNVQVQRIFRSLRIGDEFNSTDENGTIFVNVPDGIPGVDGNLTFEVVLADSDEYGTVKALVHAPIGTPIVDESTFDQRTMWSPRSKTPLFLLIFPNLLTLGMWGIIVYLIINLFKISKSKT